MLTIPARSVGIQAITLCILAGLAVTNATESPDSSREYPRTAQSGENVAGPVFAPGELIIRLTPSASRRVSVRKTLSGGIRVGLESLDRLNSKFDVRATEQVFCSTRDTGANLESIYRLTLAEGQDVERAVSEFNKAPDVEWSEPNYYSWTAVIPSDADFATQWALDNSGQSGGTPDVDIDAPEAWDIETGSADVILAIVDTGVDWDHPDLAGKIWSNPGEIAGNGVDDDGNGFIDDVRGWDFVTTTSAAPGEDIAPPDNDPMDFHGHGTHMSGIAAAVSDNGLGIAGVCWGCTIMPVRAGYKSTSGRGTLLDSDIAAAIVYAVDNGATAINMSFGSSYPSSTVGTAIDYANASGTLMVAAAGNDDRELEFYPAAFEGVFAVAATDHHDERSIWADPAPPVPGVASNYGDWVDVAAPGTGIRSTVFDDSYATFNGTSVAAPHVTGLAGLIRSAYPGLGKEEVYTAIRSTVDPLRTDDYLGTGRINAHQAIQMSAVPVARLDSPEKETFMPVSTEISGSAWSPEFLEYFLDYGAGFYPDSWTLLSHSFLALSDGVLGTWYVSGTPDGKYTLRLRVSDTAGNTAITQRIVFVDKILHSGWPQQLERGRDALLLDLDGSGELEIVLGAEDGDARAYRADGAVLPGWPQDVGVRVRMSASGADFDGDGRHEVVLAPFDWEAANEVHVWDGAGIPMPGWPKNLGGQVINPPVIADLDNDGQLEIVASTSADYNYLNEGKVFVWRQDGSDMASFPKVYQLEGGALDHASTPAVGDLDGDRDLEILVGFKDGSLHALHHDGSDVVGWPKQVHSAYTVFGVVLGDLDADGETEVVASSTNSNAVFAFEADGSLIPGWPVGPDGYYSVGEPSLANLDGDRPLEVVFHSNSDQMFAVNHDGSPLPGWPIEVEANPGNAAWSPPVFADLDGDGSPDIIQSSDEKKVHAWRADGTPVEGWPKAIAESYQGPPALADVDGDDLLELVVVDRQQIYMWDLPVPSTPQPQWPTYRGNAQRTGVYPNPAPALVSIEPTVVPSGGLPFTLVVRGARFVAGSRILWNGVDQETSFTNRTQLEALIPADAIGVPQLVDISVDSPQPGGGQTQSLSLDVCAGPPQVTGLEFTDWETLHWVDPGGNSTFAVYRGTLNSTWSYDHVCLEPGIEEPTASDGELPTVGFYYLVTTINECGEGSPGTSSRGDPRYPLAVCP